MLHRFKSLLKPLVLLSAILVTAKLIALCIDAFMPPLPLLECKYFIKKSHRVYPFAIAFSLKNAPKTVAPNHSNVVHISLKGYTLTMTSIGNPSMAIIIHNHKSKLLQIGDTIDGLKLTKVYTSMVKLVKQGHIYTLFMKKDKSNTPMTLTYKKSNAKATIDTSQIRREGNTYYIPRELTNEMHNIKTIFKYIAINPIYKNNKLKGFAIANVKKGSVFDKMGLKKLDVIEMIDHKPITSESEAFKYFNTISDIDSLSLTIRRQKEIKELNYEIF